MATQYQVNTILTNGAVINSGVVTLPTANIATSTEAGLVMPVAKTDSMTQEVGVDTEGKLYTTPGGGSSIELTSERGTDPNIAMSQLGIENIFFTNHVGLGTNSNAITGSVAIGQDAIAATGISIAIGFLANANNSIAIGGQSSSSSMGTAIGGFTTADTMHSVAIGFSSDANSTETVAIGHLAITNSIHSIAMGNGAVVENNANCSIAIGNRAEVFDNSTDSIAIGNMAKVGGNLANCIQLGTGQVGTSNTFQVGNYPLLDLTTGLIPSERLPDATIPVANSTTLGGVMPVTKTSAMTQEVGVDSTGKLYTTPGSGGGGTTIGTSLSQYVDLSSSYSTNLYPNGFIGSHNKFIVSIVIDTSDAQDDYHIFGQSIMYLDDLYSNKGFLVGINSSGSIVKACDVQGQITSSSIILLNFSNWDSNIHVNNVNYFCVTATPISES